MDLERGRERGGEEGREIAVIGEEEEEEEEEEERKERIFAEVEGGRES